MIVLIPGIIYRRPFALAGFLAPKTFDSIFNNIGIKQLNTLQKNLRMILLIVSNFA